MQQPNFSKRMTAIGFAMGLFVCMPLTVSAQSDPVAAKLPPGIVASQGGVVVSIQDIDAYAQKIPEEDRAAFFDNPKRIESVIMNMLLGRQLAADARAAKIDQDPLVKTEIKLAIDDVLVREDLRNFRKNLKVPNFEQLAKEYYLGHESEFVLPGRVNVKHVLVSTKDRSDEAAKELIAKVEIEARAHPEKFDDLVDKYSDDPTKTINHGMIPDAGSKKMSGPFAKAAEHLKKPGDISPIVKTNFGYHVLKLVEHDPATQQTFDDVRNSLIQKLRTDWVENQVAEHTGSLRGKPLNADPALVASLRTRYKTHGEVMPEQAERQDAKQAEKAKAVGETPSNTPAKHTDH